MEQLEPIIYSFSAFARGEDGETRPFHMDIFNPVDMDPDEGDSMCAVSCPYLRAKPYTIYGVDREQAFELAREFIVIYLDGENIALVDQDGTPVTLPECPPLPPA